MLVFIVTFRSRKFNKDSKFGFYKNIDHIKGIELDSLYVKDIG